GARRPAPTLPARRALARGARLPARPRRGPLPRAARGGVRRARRRGARGGRGLRPLDQPRRRRRGHRAAVIARWLGVDAFERPALLAVALAVACAAAWLAARRPPPALAWSAFDEAVAAGARRVDWARGLALAARGGALALLAVALGGPVREHRAPPPP